MKHFYILLFFITGALYAQTTVDYTQQVANYNAFFGDGGGNFDSGATEFGMWANGGNTKSVAWRNFTEDGTTSGTPSTMAIGDSFTITISATRAWGQIGVALLSSPSTLTWDDRFSNYAVQINLDGNSGAFDLPWRVVSTGGTIDAGAIFGDGGDAYKDFKFIFTLNTATTMNVSINDGTEIYNITLNNQNITGYSVYHDNDWNGDFNRNIYWKPTTEYTYAMTLGTDDLAFNLANISPNPVKDSFSINKNVSELSIYDLTGKLVKVFKGDFQKGNLFDISYLSKSLYIATVEEASGEKTSLKLLKN